MVHFKNQYAGKLLTAHQPNQRAYLCEEIGLEPNAASVTQVDSAYAELETLGYVVKCSEQTVMVYSGGVPKHPFKITEAGLHARA